MNNEFNPYPKSKQLAGHQKNKDRPKFKVQKPRKKRKPKVNKNIEMFHDRIIPHWKQRGKFSKQTVNDILRIWGEYCYVCGSPHIQIHHVFEKGFGKGGRGVKTNGLPLCMTHHTDQNEGIHHNRKLYEEVRTMFIEKFGSMYYKDKYDLWMEQLIENPTDELYEKFMEKEIEKCQKKQIG